VHNTQSGFGPDLIVLCLRNAAFEPLAAEVAFADLGGRADGRPHGDGPAGLGAAGEVTHDGVLIVHRLLPRRQEVVVALDPDLDVALFLDSGLVLEQGFDAWEVKGSLDPGLVDDDGGGVRGRGRSSDGARDGVGGLGGMGGGGTACDGVSGGVWRSGGHTLLPTPM
jgi:hypothetical protein